PAGSGAALAAGIPPVPPPVVPAVHPVAQPITPVVHPSTPAAPSVAQTTDAQSTKHERRHHRHHSYDTASASRPYATVTCSGATIRSGAGRGAASVGGLSHGSQVEIISREGDWTKVRANGQEGYVYTSLLSSTGGSAPAVGSNTSSRSSRHSS